MRSAAEAPAEQGRTDSTMRLADMQRTIHPACQAGRPNIERNCSGRHARIYATAHRSRGPSRQWSSVAGRSGVEIQQMCFLLGLGEVVCRRSPRGRPSPR